MLQIQPEKDIVVEFIKNEEFKYVRALGAFYMRLTGTSLDCYKYLEPLYNDNRKIRRQNRQAQFELVHMDEFIDELLRDERVCDVILPRVQKRLVLEENNEIEAKVSALEDDLDEEIASGDEDVKIEEKYRIEEYSKSKTSKEERSKHEEKRDRERRHKDKEHRPERKRDRDRSRERRRSRDREVRRRDKNREHRRDKESRHH
ncbi:pre-mRNA processing factor 38 [Carabus blaptoides fortunei]